MIVRLLGTGAGRGFPREDCNCRCCRTARENPSRAPARMPLCVALSADGRHWFLLHAPSSIRELTASFTPLIPKEGMAGGSPVQAVLATGIDPDQTAGLPYLAGDSPVLLYGPGLPAGTKELRVESRDAPLRPAPLPLKTQRPSGLLFWAFRVPQGPSNPRGMNASPVGYGFQDVKTGGRLVFLPALSGLDETVQNQMEGCHALLMDGTFWDEKEAVGTMAQPISSPGSHWAVGGPGGSLETLGDHPGRYRIYLHINHNNPMLIEDSQENREVRASGAEVGRDGMEFMI
jgi:pyrroloquinoline quinone biosynthesis protein B